VAASNERERFHFRKFSESFALQSSLSMHVRLNNGRRVPENQSTLVNLNIPNGFIVKSIAYRLSLGWNRRAGISGNGWGRVPVGALSLADVFVCDEPKTFGKD
jgi:hypothetical protein